AVVRAGAAPHSRDPRRYARDPEPRAPVRQRSRRSDGRAGRVTSFLIAAALMAVGALALVLIPLLRRPGAEEKRATASALVVVLALPLLAGWLYTRWSNWPWTGAPPASTAQATPEVIAMVEGLAARLEREGGTLDEWQMLGRSRVQLGQYAAAAE